MATERCYQWYDDDDGVRVWHVSCCTTPPVHRVGYFAELRAWLWRGPVLKHTTDPTEGSSRIDAGQRVRSATARVRVHVDVVC